uniref:Uncharacterized protein n=1 Tax=Romanomermis culicivorax TaxID=13658 RepID=A0A915JUK8_ROMCU
RLAAYKVCCNDTNTLFDEKSFGSIFACFTEYFFAMDTQEQPRKTRIIFSYGKMREIPIEGVVVRKKKTKKDILNDLLDKQVDVLKFGVKNDDDDAAADLDVQSREILQNLYQYFQAEKEAGDVLLPTRSASERCSLATNVANRTYRHIVAKERRRKTAASAAATGGKKNNGDVIEEEEDEEDSDYEAADDDDDDKSSTSSIDLPPDQRVNFDDEKRPESNLAVRCQAKIEPSTMRVTRSRSKSPMKTVLAAARNGYKASGVEINRWLVWYSRYKALRSGLRKNADFFIKDMWKTDFSSYDAVIVFGTENLSNFQRKV